MLTGEVIFYINGRPSGDKQTMPTGYEDHLNTVFVSGSAYDIGNSCHHLSYAATETYDVALLPEEVNSRFKWETSFDGSGCF